MNHLHKGLYKLLNTDHEPDIVVKIVLLQSLTGIGTSILVLFCIRAYFAHEIILGTLELIVGALTIANFIYFTHSSNYQFSSRIIQVLCGVLFLILNLIEKQSHSGMHLWYYTYPLLVIFLSGRKEGILWAGILLSVSIWEMMYKNTTQPQIYYSPLYILRYGISYSASAAMAYIFEFARNKVQKQYREKNQKLNISQERLKESQLNLEMVISSIKDVIFTIDMNGIIVKYFVPHSESNVINLPEDFIGNNFRNVLPDQISKELEQAISHIGSGNTWYEFEYYTGTSTYKNWFAAKVSQMSDSTQRTMGYLIIARDITKRKEEEIKRKKLESKLIQLEQSATLGRVAAGIAHEINNPASTIHSDLHMMGKLLNQFPESDIQLKLRKNIQRSYTAIKRITDIITAISYSFRKDDWRLTDINKEIDIQLTLLKKDLENKITITKHYSPLSQVKTYGNEIGQVILLILTNAIDSIKKKGYIEIRTQEDKKFITIYINDSGLGIPENILPHIFDPFYSTKTKNKGTGLGLFTCLEIMKKHHGNLTISETAVGIGTTVKLEILKEQDNNETI